MTKPSIYNLTLSELSFALDAIHEGIDVKFMGISTDTRTLAAGDLFVALQGPNFDANDYVEQAAAKGAVAALVSKSLQASIPTLQVADTRVALGQLAALQRQLWDSEAKKPLIAITGSCGKTTTKSMLAAIMQQLGRVLASKGTLNNDIGMPLTLVQLSETHDSAVIEMGANHKGEISYLTSLAQPTIAVLTNVAPVHLEGFGSLDVIARTKAEIFLGLGPTGIAIINADDPYATQWREDLQDKKVLSYAVLNDADVRGSNITVNTVGEASFQLNIDAKQIQINLPLLGTHNVMNALAAATASYVAGASLQDIKAGLENLEPVTQRLVRRRGLQKIEIIDDSYNANPLAFRAALEVLALSTGEKVLVMGQMNEMGDLSEQYHADVGHEAKKYGIQRLFGYGPLTQSAVKAFGANAEYFTDQEQLIKELKKLLHPDMTILIKGSRGMRMENIVAALSEGVNP
ncbi:UDP-N-acetylmuramoyl-tripeptide--D-alanyl-D-alanine ligase [soil metagenome]